MLCLEVIDGKEHYPFPLKIMNKSMHQLFVSGTFQNRLTLRLSYP